jgi:poly(hydroxyalkanoate) depolymerase family esterase
MTGLGDTLAGLAALKKGWSAGLGGGDAAMTEVRGFGPNPGALRMLAYVPDALRPGAPLVVTLHGCTQSAGGHASAAGWLTLADRLGFAVLAPEQVMTNNPNRCFNWFEPGDTRRGAGEAASIHAMVQSMIEAHGLDAERVFVTGLSAGGAMTAAMLTAYPETFAAGAVVAGLPYGAASNVQEAMMAMRTAGGLTAPQLTSRVLDAAPAPRRWPRLSIWHGDADHTVSDANAQALERQWTGVHGLSPQPDSVETHGGWTRTRWLGAGGAVLVERNTLAGLGHGAPLSTTGEDAIGHTAPFMLEAGVSSALEIARFWGLDRTVEAPVQAAPAPRPRAAAPRTRPRPAPALVPEPVFAPEPAPAPQKPALGETVMAAVSPHVSAKIGQVIARALKAAGLMR